MPCRPESACACTGLLFFLPLVSIPESRFGRFWANQGLLILLLEAISLLLWFLLRGMLTLLGLIPYLGIVFRALLVPIGLICLAIPLFYMSYGMVYAIRGRAKEIPLFGFIRLIR